MRRRRGFGSVRRLKRGKRIRRARISRGGRRL